VEDVPVGVAFGAEVFVVFEQCVHLIFQLYIIRMPRRGKDAQTLVIGTEEEIFYVETLYFS
jgi:hypothetical protein